MSEEDKTAREVPDETNNPLPGAGSQQPVAGDTEQQAQNAAPEIQNMEVHHHPQLEHKPKPWKEYLLEYIMIVLAVVTGFFAETIREHIGDNDRKNEYLKGLVAELKYDTAQYNLVMSNIVYIRPILDSMYVNATQPGRFNYVLQARWNTPINETHFYYTPALPVIEQLKSSGNLRLINARQVAQQILEYDTYVQVSLAPHSAEVAQGADKVYNLEDAMCDEKEFSAKLDENMASEVASTDISKSALYNMPLVVKDPLRLNELANSFINYKARMYGYYAVTAVALKKATALIEEIKKEYGLDDAE
jgi:hypothetical protein